jgi:hypothetical protein
VNIDLSSIEADALNLLDALLLAMLSLLAKRAFTKLGLVVTQAQQDNLDDIAHKAVTFGISTATADIKAKGWDHIDVKNAVVAAAGQYAVAQFPDALKQAGVDISNPGLAAGKLADGIMTRVFPAAASQAAHSPVTPPMPPLMAPAANPLDTGAKPAP